MQNLGPFQTHLEIKQQIFVYYNWMKNDKVLILEFSPNGRVELKNQLSTYKIKEISMFAPLSLLFGKG